MFFFVVFYRPWTYVKQLVHEFMFRFAIVCEISFCHDVVGQLCVVPKRHLFNNEAGIYLARFYRKHHPKTGILTYTKSLPDLAYGKTWQNMVKCSEGLPMVWSENRCPIQTVFQVALPQFDLIISYPLIQTVHPQPLLWRRSRCRCRGTPGCEP